MWNREIELQHNRPLRICRLATVECRTGTIWVTNSALAGDLFLRAGERRRLPAGITLIEALGTARVVLRPAGLWRIAHGVADFFRRWAHRRASQYRGVYLHSR